MGRGSSATDRVPVPNRRLGHYGEGDLSRQEPPIAVDLVASIAASMSALV
jgi:hypothetical protein